MTDLSDRERHVVACAVAETAKVLRRVVVSVAAVAVITIAGAGAGWTFVRQESVNRTNEINASRIQVLTSSCRETNERNRGTLAKLDELRPAHPTARQLQSIQSTKLLIAALVPYRPDCGTYARDRLSAP